MAYLCRNLGRDLPDDTAAGIAAARATLPSGAVEITICVDCG